MFSVGFLEIIAGAVWVAAWSACFPEKKSNFTKMKALELCRW